MPVNQGQPIAINGKLLDGVSLEVRDLETKKWLLIQSLKLC